MTFRTDGVTSGGKGILCRLFRSCGRETMKCCGVVCFAVSVLLSLMMAGCVETPVRPARRLILPEIEAPAETQARRAAEFRELTGGVRVRGIGIYPAGMRGNGIPATEILDRIEALGFNRIYCHLSSEKQLDEFLRDLIVAASGRNIPVEIVLNQRDFYRRATGNKLVRLFRPSYPRLDEAAKLVSEFNSLLPEGVRLAGLTVISEPHLFTAVNPDIPPDSLYYWSEDSFGPDLDNALLMREALDMLGRVAAENPELPLTSGMADFYHELAESGKLPLGKISDFCAISPRVMLLDYGNKPSAAATAVENELAALPGGCSALVGINLAGHTSVDAGALRRRDWRDLMRGMKYLLGRFGRHAGFEGFVLAPLSALEFIRMERE